MAITRMNGLGLKLTNIHESSVSVFISREVGTIEAPARWQLASTAHTRVKRPWMFEPCHSMATPNSPNLGVLASLQRLLGHRPDT